MPTSGNLRPLAEQSNLKVTKRGTDASCTPIQDITNRNRSIPIIIGMIENTSPNMSNIRDYKIRDDTVWSQRLFIYL